MEKLTTMSLSELRLRLDSREISSVELTNACLSKINTVDEQIGAYITVTPGLALHAAEAYDEGKTCGVLAGIPCAVKDNICTKGIRTTCASKMLEDFVPPYDATVIGRLYRHGFVCTGKLNMDEFAMGSSTESSAFHITKNPLDHALVPGGSSGGSAAAVAAGLVPYTLGSDTGGSIRQPAAFCGIVGMKPTYGTVSRYGLIAFASSLDQIGPMTKTVYDNAMVYSVIRGHDPQDATSLKDGYADVLSHIKDGVKDIKIAILSELLGNETDPEIRESVYKAGKCFESLGAKVEEIHMQTLSSALPAYYILSSAEASSNLARYDGVRYGHRTDTFSDVDSLYKASRSEGFGDEVKRRILLGTFALSSGFYDAYYKKARQTRNSVVAEFDKVFETYDVLLSPVTPTLPYPLGAKDKDPTDKYSDDFCTASASLAGLPALSLPCGKAQNGMPIGMQLIGKRLCEPLLYKVAYAYETMQKERDWS